MCQIVCRWWLFTLLLTNNLHVLNISEMSTREAPQSEDSLAEKLDPGWEVKASLYHLLLRVYTAKKLNEKEDKQLESSEFVTQNISSPHQHLHASHFF